MIMMLVLGMAVTPPPEHGILLLFVMINLPVLKILVIHKLDVLILPFLAMILINAPLMIVAQ
jgi:hypothetical protein